MGRELATVHSSSGEELREGGKGLAVLGLGRLLRHPGHHDATLKIYYRLHILP